MSPGTGEIASIRRREAGAFDAANARLDGVLAAPRYTSGPIDTAAAGRNYGPVMTERMSVVSEQFRDPHEAARMPPIGGLVIACIDEGARGQAAARIADSLAKRLGSRLLLATVAQPLPRTPPGGDVTSGLVRRSRELLAGVARELDQPAELRVAFGEPAERLIALAQREAAELIVVAAPDRSRATTLLGSVHIALAGAGPCPVVVVPPNVERMPTGGPIVCGVDGAEPSRIAAHFAADLAGRLDARLKLVQATGALPATARGARGGYGAALRPQNDAAVRMVQDAAEGLLGEKPAYLLVEPGPPAERLADVARRESAQLLVTGARGSDQPAPVLLGSVASELATTATQPLVIVPPRARPRQAPRAVILATRHLRRSVVLQVTGEIDFASAIELERQAASLLTEAGGRLVLDLSETTFADAAEAHVTERLARRASELGGCLAVVVTTPAVRGIVDLIPHRWRS